MENNNDKNMEDAEKTVEEVEVLVSEFASKMNKLVEENKETTHLNYLLVSTADYNKEHLVIGCNAGIFKDLLKSFVMLASPMSPLNEKAGGLFCKLFHKAAEYLLFEKAMHN